MRLAFVALLAIALVACGTEPTPTPAPPCPTAPPSAVEAQAELENAGIATVTVSGAVEGEFTFELYGEQAPIAAANFVALARCGFYDGIKFHRVIAGFVIQAGDPQTKQHDGDFRGIGSGGAGYEYGIEPPAEGLAYDQYSVSVANNGQTNDSQFFIALEDLDQGLARNYTIFGQVTSGTEVVDAIGQVPVNDPRVGVPLTPVTIESIEIAAAEAEG